MTKHVQWSRHHTRHEPDVWEDRMYNYGRDAACHWEVTVADQLTITSNNQYRLLQPSLHAR